MADKKVTDLPELSSLSEDDLILGVNDPSGAPATYKITVANLLSSILLDEDDMVSDSAVFGVTQQSVKAHVAAAVAGGVTASSTTTFTNKTIDADADGNSITNIEAADIKNRTRNISIGVNDMLPVVGATIAATSGGQTIGVLYDDASTEDAFAVVVLPEDLVTGAATVKWFWSMETATSGNVVIQQQVAKLRDDSAITSIDELLNHTQTVAVPGAADTVKVTSFNTFTATAGDSITLRMLRTGADASDTATGDLNLHAVEIEYTADM